MIVDSLTFVGDSIFGNGGNANDLLDRMDEAGVDRAIVCPVKPPGYHLQAANNTVAEAVRAYSDRFVGVARVDPLLGDAARAEIDRALDDLGLAGIFLHPWEETFRVNAHVVDGVVEAARQHRVPVIIATGYPWVSEALQVGHLAQRFPDVSFILTNGGQLNISGLGQTDAELTLRDNPNTFVQTAGTYREDFLEGIIERLGADRLLFASASPVMDPRLEILRVRWCHAAEEAKEAILGKNAIGLFDL